MKFKSTIFFFLSVSFISCNELTDKETDSIVNEKDCKSFPDKKTIYQLADSVITNHDNENIWNLSEIDTTDFFSMEDYFTDAKNKTLLVLIGGSAGLSAGSAHNLLMLISCTDTSKVIWASQEGDLDKNNITDLNNDGIKEIIFEASMTWMGECNDSYKVLGFKNGKLKSLYSAISTSVIGCGRENFGELFERDDTLENTYKCEPIVQNKNYFIRQIQTTKIHNGGNTDEDIVKNVKTITDTTMIGLK